MSFSAPFIRRPVATLLLAVGIMLAGITAYFFLPVAPLPSVDIPTIVVFANRPGADPETMANSITAPLERRLGEIPGVSEMTSTSSVGAATIIIRFDPGRNIDSAARDVQAALNAAAPDLPSGLPRLPRLRKFNPAAAPIMTLALTSDTLSLAKLYDVADSILAQRLSQVEGVAQVTVSGAEKPAIRVQVDPGALAAAGLSLEDVTAAIRAANVIGPTGAFDGAARAESIGINGQMTTPARYRRLVLKTAGGAALRLGDVAHVVDGVANNHLAASLDGKPAILLEVSKTYDANVIATAARVRAMLPLLRSWMPPDVKMTVLVDRTTTIRASVDDVQITLAISIALVLLVVLLFMRRRVPTIAAGVTVPLSLAGTVAAMWLCGFSLDNFSLMALTICVGFVVDDAIVMIENIVRHIERGQRPLQAAFDGARQIGFTVFSISLSLVAVFIPVLFMGGILGRLFNEFAVTLVLAIVVSAAVSLTLTPMLCGRFMGADAMAAPGGWWGRVDRAIEHGFSAVQRGYGRTLAVALRHPALMIVVTLATVGLTVWLYTVVPKGFMPRQDLGQLRGSTIADPDTSFQAMERRQQAVVAVILRDPAVAGVASRIGVSSGFSSLNRGRLTVALKPRDQRDASAEQVIARLRGPLAQIGGVRTVLYAAQELRGGGRPGSGNEIVLLSENLATLRHWAQRLEDRLEHTPGLVNVESDQDRSGPEARLEIDRNAAARLGVSVAAIDAALNDAFAQRQISTIYDERNQYPVVVEVSPVLQTDPSALAHIFVAGRGGHQVPLGAVTRVVHGTAALAVRHQGQIPAATISYNAAIGVADATALKAAQQAVADLRMPESVRTAPAGTSRWLQQSLASQPLLILAAFLAIYIVLGVLYESLTQPITIISTLPSAGLGALLALLATGYELSLIAVIGILLLMGIVKKNAIMLVDFALEQERRHGRTPREAIHAACLERFRPIMMTTLAALLGALPLAFAFGTGAELRRPLGVAVIGGLIVSQALTLYTTPIVYLALQRRRRVNAASASPHQAV